MAAREIGRTGGKRKLEDGRALDQVAHEGKNKKNTGFELNDLRVRLGSVP